MSEDERYTELRKAVKRVLAHCWYCYHGSCRAEAHRWLREAADLTQEEIRAEGDRQRGIGLPA